MEWDPLGGGHFVKGDVSWSGTLGRGDLLCLIRFVELRYVAGHFVGGRFVALDILWRNGLY